MLGDPGFQANLNVETGIIDHSSLRSSFLPRGGAMIRKYNPLTPSKSLKNISAVLALEQYRIPNPLFATEFNGEAHRRATRLRRQLTAHERAEVSHSLISGGVRYTLGETYGLTVCNNPFANIPLPDSLFNGAFDVRWSILNDELTPVFFGEQRLALEQEEIRT